MNQGNPFNLKALVDKWPDFKTVVIRPQEQVRGQGQKECASVFVFAMCPPGARQCGRPCGYRNEMQWQWTGPRAQEPPSLEGSRQAKQIQQGVTRYNKYRRNRSSAGQETVRLQRSGCGARTRELSRKTFCQKGILKNNRFLTGWQEQRLRSKQRKEHPNMCEGKYDNVVCEATSVVSDSLRPHGWQPTRLLCPWDSPGKNAGVGCHFLLQW